MRTASLTDTGSVSIPPRATRGTDEKRRMLWRRILIVLAVGQPVSSLVFDWLSPTTLQSGAEFSPLVPPGAWFAVWGVIIVLSIAYALAQVRPSTLTPLPSIRDRVVGPLSVVFACFGLWLATAALGQDNPLGLVVFVVIISAHVVAWTRVVRARDELASWNPLERGLLYGLLGTYSGWTSMAFFVQIGTVTQGTGAPVDTAWGQVWQSLVLLAATGLAVSFVLGSRASIVYAATVTYALIGVGISTGAAGLGVLTLVCVIGVTLVWASVVVIRASDARHPSPTPRGSQRPR
ncbi:hypothetical protein [Microcella alkalica]|uniref:hypothetical protein n=1 Tax=Microcella alkalica TaxID=355930 RepID=UPI00145D775C|nr:hypothetical protein [Microcella alkalica]